MRVLIVGLNYKPEPVGIGPYTADLAEYLARAGHDVEAIVGEPYYPRWERLADAPPRGRRVVEGGVGVRRCRHYIPRIPTGARRIAHHITFALTSLAPTIVTAVRLRPQVVIAVTPSLISIVVAWLAARLIGARLWTHVQDFEVEAAFATELLAERSLVGRFAQAIEHRCLGMSDRVSSISPQMVTRLHGAGIPAARTYELRNWANADLSLDAASDAAVTRGFREQWDIADRKVVLYSGSIANKQGIDIVIDAARRLQTRTDIAFVICGQGPNRERLRAMAEGLANVQFRDLQPQASLRGLLALATMHVLPQIPAAADLVLPSKLSNMLASGRPIVATAEHGTGIAQEVDECGIVTPPGDMPALAEAIVLLADDPAIAAAYGRNGERRARARWGKLAILGRFELELERFGQRSTQGVNAIAAQHVEQ